MTDDVVIPLLDLIGKAPSPYLEGGVEGEDDRSAPASPHGVAMHGSCGPVRRHACNVIGLQSNLAGRSCIPENFLDGL